MLMMVAVRALPVAVCALLVIGVSARNDNGNFLDDKWSGGRLDRFRDEVEEAGSWATGKAFDQALDPIKDPCLKMKCGRHKVCVAEDYRTPRCVSQRTSFKAVSRLKCKACPVVRPSPVCGSDGSSYSSKCKLEYQACVSGKQISVQCQGQCPCPSVTPSQKKECSSADMAAAVSRMRDWITLLHQNSNHGRRQKFQKPERNLDTSKVPLCKDSVGWMFSRLDLNFNLQLDQSELSGLSRGERDMCRGEVLRSCDFDKDSRVSSQEWCLCFQRYQESPCKSETINLQKQRAGKKLLGPYVPSCDVNGFYRPQQCHGSSGQCWCVDRYGNEVAGSHTRGAADCGTEASGHQGSGDSLLMDDEDGDGDEDDEEFGFLS